jgi:geranylgeranyl diphosphate synthase type I
MRTEVTVGQYLDMHAQMLPWTDDFDADERRAREVVRSKSARYSVESPILLGAALAGATAREMEVCSAVGLPLGEAFQLRDDLLGAFGDPAITGKPVGDDLAQGKVTRLLELGIERTEGADQAVLLRLGSPAMQDDDPERGIDILVSSGARHHVEQRIDQLVEEALAAIGSAPIDPAMATLLGDAAVLIANRDH